MHKLLFYLNLKNWIIFCTRFELSYLLNAQYAAYLLQRYRTVQSKTSEIKS